ncbi:MAG: penicillin-binding protein activator [Pseudomonadota bacterium]
MNRCLLLLLALALLAGCASGPGVRRSADPATAAAESYALGQYDLALAEYQRLIQRQPQAADRWRLRAADAAFLLGEENTTIALLNQIDLNRVSPEDRRLANLLLFLAGEINPASPGVRLSMLGNAERWPAPYRPLVLRQRARELAANGQPYRAGLALVEYGQTLTDLEQAERNRADILRTLTPLSGNRALDLLSSHQPDEEMYGWLALVADIRGSLQGSDPRTADLAEVVAAWRLRFPAHPAAGDQLELLLGGTPVQNLDPDRIAVLLPFSGRFPAAARAVRDGLLSAYYGDARRRAEIQFYDTGDNPREAIAQYRRAVADGADQIIGPLERDAVTAILLESDGSVPVLALNHQAGDAPPAPGNLQFGLLPEEEARSVARRLVDDGLLRVAMLASADAWGQRVSTAFFDHFTRLGGVIISQATFQPLGQDFSAQVSQLVGTTDAEIRRRQLARAFGFPLSFEARPRHDLDAVFLAARTEPARLIKPQLAFFNAGQIPVYSTSHVFDGSSDRNRNRDLNGITFCDAPFLLDLDRFEPNVREAEAQFADLGGLGSRLFALGMDAYRVLPYLNLLASMGTEFFPGATGQLSLDAQGYLFRRLSCARFAGGEPTLVERSVDPSS